MATSESRFGASFRLLMQVRMLVTLIMLLSLGPQNVDIATVVIVLALAFLYWLVSRNQERIVPYLLRHPLLTGLDIFVSFMILSFEGPQNAFFLSTVAASALAGLLFRWQGALAVSVLQVICYFASIGYYAELSQHDIGSQLGHFQTAVAQPAYYPIVGFVGVMLRRLFDQQDRAEAGRRDAEVRSAAADERARLAREMHDSLAKSLRGIAMSATALPTWVKKSPERAIDEATRIASAAEVASREARELIAELRDDQAQRPLAATVDDVVHRWSERTGIDAAVDLDSDADVSLMARYETVAILKETLANVERHADASAVRVALAGTDEAITLTIIDDGRGFPSSCDGTDWLRDLARAGHYGIIGMHERAKRAGAELRLTSEPGSGSTIEIQIPLVDQSAPTDSQPTERQPAEAG